MSRQMKDSGIEWIGEIPGNWKVVSLNKIANIQTGSTPTKTNQEQYYSDEHGIPWIKAEDLDTGTSIEFTSEYLTPAGCKIGRVFPPNTVYVCCIASVGKVGYSCIECSCNQQINALIFKNNYSWKYGYFVSLSQETEYINNSSGNVMKIINSDKQSRLKCPLPPLPEQTRIAAFLDEKCAHIDSVIEKTKQSIEEYKKLKQAVITQAVTKGVRGKREMKDSGVEWIGEIPKEWEIHKFCWDYSAMLGKMLDAKRVSGSKLHPYIKNADVQWWSINSESLDEMDFDDSEYERYSVKAGDLMICEGGDIGKCAIIPDDFPEGIYYQKALHRVRARTDKGNLHFLSFVMFAMAKGNSFNSTHEKATIAHLPGDALAQLRIPTPPYEEQQEIAAYLDQKCAEIDTLITKKEQFLTELESYKKSMIYEYVTGKKEVEP